MGEAMGKLSGILMVSTAAFVFAAAFQNCSKMDFGASAVDGASLSLNADGSYSQMFAAETMKINGRVDLLFVVDESASMSVVINNVIDGFNAIAKVAYPPDTRMAVTNMAPAFYTNANSGIFDPTKSLISLAGANEQPGFIKLVDDSNIKSFLSTNPTRANRFPKPGCAHGWFLPSEKNMAGDSCLSAHSQIALFGTGYEAGLVSVEQLNQMQAASGGQLFRPGVLANVVFISDTHDAGAPYYGRAGARTERITPQSLSKSIYDANPQLAGLKFHGIVPLPPAGHEALNGVKTMGNLPASLDKSKVSGEDLWDFSYLPFVAKSGGLAMHPVNNDWSTLIGDLVKDLAVSRAPSVVLAVAAVEVLQVKVAGVELNPSEYSLLADGRTIQIAANANWPNPVEVSVTFRRF
jgi:hypothetical protein